MSIRKGGWERAKEFEKKMHDENKLLKKIPKINSFFTAMKKVDATNNITLNSLPFTLTSQVGINHKEETVKIAFELGHSKKFEDGADTGSGTIPNVVGGFGDITDHVRNMCISLGTIHFRNLADSYPETKREYSGVNCFLNYSVFKFCQLVISVDSTLDITHCDQLTIILRYINMVDYQPVERFLTFINISSYTGQNLDDTLLQYLSDQDIDY
nr:uncharacterized protein LOC124817511 [Hydra vulgaris]